MNCSNASRTSSGRVLVIGLIVSGAERHLAGIAIDRPALVELVRGEAALVGAGAALQLLGAEGAGEFGAAQGLADAGAELDLEDFNDAGAGDSRRGRANAECVEGG